MSIQNNNISIFETSGYSPTFTWQVGFQSQDSINQNLQFRATIRAINGLESVSRIPSDYIYYEETGILINNIQRQGSWNFPLGINAQLTGGPYRDYQVVIEAHDTNGNTSAGNTVLSSNNEGGWNAFSQGYDIIAISNPRQTGIELTNNLPTQDHSTEGISWNYGHGYSTLNYMDSHGGINIKYLSGVFNSNLVGGYIYVWTGQFPKNDTLLGINGYDKVEKSRFSFDPKLGYVYHPTAAMSFRGANSIYVSLSFFDNLDFEALNNNIDISTGLYLSDNAICYNDIAAGSLSLGGMQSLYSLQYTGNANPTGVIGTGVFILASRYYNESTTVLYLSNPTDVSSYGGNFTGYNSLVPGGAGGSSVLLNNSPTHAYASYFNLNLSGITDDSFCIYINGTPLKDDDNAYPNDPTGFNILQLAANKGIAIKIGDKVSFASRDNLYITWSTQEWTAELAFNDGTEYFVTGGYYATGLSTGVLPVYRDNGYLVVGEY